MYLRKDLIRRYRHSQRAGGFFFKSQKRLAGGGGEDLLQQTHHPLVPVTGDRSSLPLPWPCSSPCWVASAAWLAERMVLHGCHGSSRMWFLW